MSITNITPRETELQRALSLARGEASVWKDQVTYDQAELKTVWRMNDALKAEVAELKSKLAKFDKPLPTTAELFEIYCNDKLAGDWHRAQQNYEAGFIAALKWVASHDHHPNQTRLP